MQGEWRASEEFGQRLGCGLVAAGLLPAWFLLVYLALDRSAGGPAAFLALALAVASAAGAALGVRRIRRTPRTVRIEGGSLTVASAAASTSRPIAELASVEIGAGFGLAPVRLVFRDRSVLAIPRELENFDGLLDALAARNPTLAIRRPQPGGPGG
ncbi:MAG: hypothetical protein ACKVWR_13595 [Acidimicrobiales bacterium]